MYFYDFKVFFSKYLYFLIGETQGVTSLERGR